VETAVVPLKVWYLGHMKMTAGLMLATTFLCFPQGLSNRRAPSFNLPDSTLKRYDILDYRGKFLLVDFMKTDCPHCQELSQTLEKVQARYGAKVAILSVVIAPPENQTTVGKYMKDFHLANPIVFDQGQVAAAYFLATPQRPGFDTPHLFVIDPNGNIVRDWGHSDATHEVFEPEGLFKQLDPMIRK
jgi:peroxiredoxin